MRKLPKSKYWGKPFAAPPHPYVEYENTPLWRATKKALADLEESQDVPSTNGISTWLDTCVAN